MPLLKVCRRFAMDHWRLFNRLGGLLGNYNGEASDDLRGPGDKEVQDAAQLATQWAISSTPCYLVCLAQG